MWLCNSRSTAVPINQVPNRPGHDSFVAHSASEQQLTEERTIVSLHLDRTMSGQVETVFLSFAPPNSIRNINIHIDARFFVH